VKTTDDDFSELFDDRDQEIIDLLADIRGDLWSIRTYTGGLLAITVLGIIFALFRAYILSNFGS